VYPPSLKLQSIGTSLQAVAAPSSNTQLPVTETAMLDGTENMVTSPCTLRLQGSDTASVMSDDYPQTQIENVNLIKNLVN
jgi:hypothetical protein